MILSYRTAIDTARVTTTSSCLGFDNKKHSYEFQFGKCLYIFYLDTFNAVQLKERKGNISNHSL